MGVRHYRHLIEPIPTRVFSADTESPLQSVAGVPFPALHRGETLAFHYTRPPLTQGIATTVMFAGAVALGAAPGMAEIWKQIVETVPEWILVVGVPHVGHLLLYWVVVGLVAYVDRTDRPAFISKHRIQTGPRRQPSLRKVLPNLALNQLVWSPLLLLGLWGLLRLRGWAPSPELPSVLRLFVEVAAMGACSLVWFYGSHRFLHRPYWMKKVHHVHHEFRTSTAIASEYAHPIEFVAANFQTLACGVILVAPSLPALYLYTLIAVSTVLVHHSGYALPWASWSVHHDWHHYRYKECFGTLGIIDRVMGTDPEFHTLEHGDTR